MKTVTLNLELEVSPAEAMALAQFVKRVGWHEYIENAVDNAEANLIGEAVAKLQTALKEEGYAPR